jgi:ferredoxin
VVGGGNVAFDAARTALRAEAGRSVGPEPADTASMPGTPEDARRGMTTTLDVARAAVRAGVLDVTVIALESPEEIPADPEEIADAEAEGIKIIYRKGPHRFVGDEGRVTGLETIDVQAVFDEEGRFNPTFVADTEAVLPADSVILAVGQAADLGVLAGIDLALSRGGVQVDPVTLQTSHPRIWAGGDVAHGPRNLIDAIADGQRAAAAIHASFATGDRHDNGVEVEVRRRATFRRLSTGYDAIERQTIPATPSERRVGFAEVEVGYDAEEATLEGLRCLRCFDNVMLDADLCILCGLCVDVCPTDCITIARADTCMQKAVNSPAILYMFGIMRSSPCEAVNVVASAPPCNAPCTAPAAPPSDCISTTLGTVPQMFRRPLADQSSAHSPMLDEGVIG